MEYLDGYCWKKMSDVECERRLLSSRQFPKQDFKPRLCRNIYTGQELERFRAFNTWRKSIEGKAEIIDVESWKVHGMSCSKCKLPITSREYRWPNRCMKERTNVVVVMTTGSSIQGEHPRLWHPTCFHCVECREPLVDLVFYPLKWSHLFCARHHAEMFMPRCFECDELIFTDEFITFQGRRFHKHHGNFFDHRPHARDADRSMTEVIVEDLNRTNRSFCQSISSNRPLEVHRWAEEVSDDNKIEDYCRQSNLKHSLSSRDLHVTTKAKHSDFNEDDDDVSCRENEEISSASLNRSASLPAMTPCRPASKPDQEPAVPGNGAASSTSPHQDDFSKVATVGPNASRRFFAPLILDQSNSAQSDILQDGEGNSISTSAPIASLEVTPSEANDGRLDLGFGRDDETVVGSASTSSGIQSCDSASSQNHWSESGHHSDGIPPTYLEPASNSHYRNFSRATFGSLIRRLTFS